MTRNEHIGSSLVIIAAAGYGFIYSLRQLAPSNMSIDPYLFPMVTLGLITLLGVIRLITGLRMPKAKGEEKSPLLPVKSLLTIALLVLYAIFFKRLGFILTSFLYLMAQMLILWEGKMRIWLLLLISITFSLGVYLLFVNVFHVLLPMGVLQF